MTGGWIDNFDEYFPEFAGKRYAFYCTIQDLINLALLREKPDDSYRLEKLLPRQPWVKSASEEREERAAYKEDLKLRNIIDISDIEMTELGKGFREFITNPIESNSANNP
jgi:hypothetical protein